ncbi:hypothetical protein J7I93_09300 [Bacillus sp. ISL-47]|uniref:hypothetical protein n=1 Tax=Bacillus sp. ISL-47 TaxID=2819130 RepID=UPI001BE8DB03|nr:hypothetical protein [Bacillus sp. ISL-47]MBT2688377.1 hypothetical protein [Bacillus sp. ISL-47]MBT2710512.1 hypothetical protein [Pseudomonas sp. ISL-84]
MKRKWIVVFLICVIGFLAVSHLSTNALNSSADAMPEFTYSSKEKNQAFGYFMLDLYHSEIMHAMKDYYKDDKISGYRTPNPPHYDMVSIKPFEKGVQYKGFEKKYTYLLKIKLLPSYNNGKILGLDTLYFAVAPYRQTMKNLPNESPAAELVKYEHSKPPKKTH